MAMLKKPALLLSAFATVVSAGQVFANAELLKLQEDPNLWVMPNGNYSSTRYSALDQINTS
ncbi:MAG: methanol dehydrogenase, partial [Chromatiaceae bacterium]|nr:methanol dehydrogenase [Chromatiaceae bacterium]